MWMAVQRENATLAVLCYFVSTKSLVPRPQVGTFATKQFLGISQNLGMLPIFET